MKTLGKFLAAGFVLTVLLFATGFVLNARTKLRAHTTAGRMSVLSRELHGLQPKDVTPETLLRLLSAANCPECLGDAWGHPLRVERIEKSDGAVDFRITSMGSDGEAGRCCEKWVSDAASDAVLLNDDWLQIWSIPSWP